MPTPEERRLMLAYHEYDTNEFAARKAAAILEANRVEPHLGSIRVALDVDVRRFVAVAGEKEATVRADAKNGGHSEKESATDAERFKISVAT